MYIPEDLKVNKFVAVKLPKNCDYFARFGFKNPTAQMYTGDNCAVMPQNKVDQIYDYQRYVEMMANTSSDES